MKKVLFAAGLLACFGMATLALPGARAQDASSVIGVPAAGTALYAAKCAGCHGPDGAKGLKGKSAEFVTGALTGYRAKTFGGAKKEIMEARAAQLTDAEIETLAKTIAAF